LQIRKIVPVVVLAFQAVPVHGADGRWNAGAEMFFWHEYIPSCPQLLEERGPRFFLGYEGRHHDVGDWELGWKGRAYGGVVVYDGFNQSCSPLGGNSNYIGLNGEAEARRWFAEPAPGSSWPRLGIGTALGLDTWRRTISVPGGYSEDYAIGFARLSLEAKRGKRWSARAGIKQPVASYEIARLGAIGFSSDAFLHPKGAVSYFAHLDYRSSASSDVTFYYDSYRFSPSDSVPIASCPPASSACSVHQPRSQQDTVGVSWRLSL
jgi:hypothetical protein